MAASAKYADVFLALFPLLALAENPVPAITPAPNGPYRIEGNRILDSQSRPYLIRGTQLAPLTISPTDEHGSTSEFGPLSATTLVTIRQRLNMNAVRIPVNSALYEAQPEYRHKLDKFVSLANQFELLVILQANQSGNLEAFWSHVAERFKDNPNVFFAPLSARLVATIRATGARQPVIVSGADLLLQDRNVVYELTPHYSAIRTDDQRRQQFALGETAPLLVSGLDPQFELPSGECIDFPLDPAEAAALVEANLTYFDTKGISWTASSFTPGKLIADYRWFVGTKLNDGWACGNPAGAGLGLALLAHLWTATPLGLFTVSHSRGGLVIARGGLSSTYGPILGDRECSAKGPLLPTVLGNISIRVTDSLGVARMARLLYTGAGWSSANFITPENAAPGPAEVAVVRTDGSVARSKVLIADIAPAILTSPPDGRSAANGQVTQLVTGKPDRSFPSWDCGKSGCRTLPIPLSKGVSTTVRLIGSGFRYSGKKPDVHVTVGGIPVPVLSMGPGTAPGTDQLTIQLPDALEGAGETDLYFKVNGELSNVARINCGTWKRTKSHGNLQPN